MYLILLKSIGNVSLHLHKFFKCLLVKVLSYIPPDLLRALDSKWVLRWWYISDASNMFMNVRLLSTDSVSVFSFKYFFSKKKEKKKKKRMIKENELFASITTYKWGSIWFSKVECVVIDIKHEYLRSRASTCVSLSSPSSYLLAISLVYRVYLPTSPTCMRNKIKV